MKKRIIVVLSLVAALMMSVAAVAFAATADSAKTIAQKYVPAGAMHSYTHDDGYKYEVHFNNGDIHYEVEVNKVTDNVIEYKMEAHNDRGSNVVTINEYEVKNIIAKDFADANIYKIKLDKDNGLMKYEVSFSASGIRKAEYEINPQSGAIIEKTIKY